MKKTSLYFSLLLAVVMLLTCACQSPSTQNTAMPEIQPKRMIIDTDAGGDDAAAIIMAALQPEIDLLGITVVSGNVPLEQGAENALMSLEVAGRTDVPVYCGPVILLQESSMRFSAFTAKTAWAMPDWFILQTHTKVNMPSTSS